jgi:transcriptional regulator with PAS, ATPase and Fis domain
LGDSDALFDVRRQIEIASRTSSKVLITGETGVGKEVVARLIHARSVRAARAFVAVNCSGIPETLLESELFGHMRGSFTGAFRDKPGLIRRANGGTFFLDELAEMSLRMQAVLLRYAESGELQSIGAHVPELTDIRLITATNRDLRARIASGAFREDLYYRLNVIQIAIPPLRDRPDDIGPLFEYYLRLAYVSRGENHPELTASARDVLATYAWPGNIRELKNIAERLALRGLERPVEPADLPTELLDGRALPGARLRSIDQSIEQPQLPGAQSRPGLSESAERAWQQLTEGHSFWTAVHEPFKRRELTRQDLAALIDLGLRRASGNYRALLKVVNLPPSDYKRLHAFLYQQKCNLPVRAYRVYSSSTKDTGNAVA